MKLSRIGRRFVAASLSGLLVTTLLVVPAPEPAAALANGGPSQPLPDTPQTNVTNPASKPPRPADQASASALSGNQPDNAPPAPAGSGSLTATSLSPSATWQVSPHTGDFTWSYPLRVPPAPGGLEPELGLSYASSAVDGRTSATNNQASWVGDGWSLEVGFIERTYGGCSDDDMGGTIPPKTGDLCWRNDNAMASSNGILINESGNRWRAKSDDGARIERLTGAANGDADGEHWKITSVDGTQYFYGSRPEAKSTWTVPVYGDDVNEPCHGSTFATSRCTQAWRWNLDKVIDPHGNMMVYSYDVETNSYGANLQDAAVPYVRGGALRKIEYGLRSDNSVAATGQVEFLTDNRCVKGSECTAAKKNNWPDVPWDSNCAAATCFGNYSPSFWTTKRLAKIVTRVRGAAGFTDVDSWTLNHEFPNPGDQEKAALWLKSIVHTGHVGGTIALPAVTFEGTAKPNRVFYSTGIGPLNRYRITAVVSESGGVITVVYAAPNCVEGTSMPASPEHNTLRCYPARWSPPGGNERIDYFHKYVVAEVVESDRYDGTSEQRTSYHYLDGAAWHFDTSEFAKDDKKTWNEFRGFGRVRTRTGNTDDPAGPVSEQEQRFYRGMDQDRLPSNGRRSVTVTDSRGGSRTDSDWFAGTEFENATFNGVNGPVVETDISTPVAQGPNATRGELKSYLVRTGTETTATALADDKWRITRTDSKYDDRGQVIEVDDQGDVNTSADDECNRKSYARNTDRWILALPYRDWTVSVRCGATGGETLSDTRTGYDGLAIGTAPTAGSVTRREELAESGYVMTSTSTYDVHGRVTGGADALGNKTSTEYTPAVGGPLTKTIETNAKGHVTTTTVAPAWGVPMMVVDPNLRRTETAYDALGRSVAIWQPNRKRPLGDSASATFTYLIRNDGPTVVTSSRLNARGDYTVSKEIYDPLMRLRQVQTPASGGGRLLTDTRYDSHGRAYFKSAPYFHNTAIDDSLWVAVEAEKLGTTLTSYDGAGRTVATAFRGGGDEKWRTTQEHEGDRVHTTPPLGGTASTVVIDARGQTTELHQYRGGVVGGTPDITRYTYHKGGELASIIDAMGNTWRYTYDQRGSLIQSDDPDKGRSQMAYDAAQRLTAVTDARGATINYAYDVLGRKTSATKDGKAMASWVYDTAEAGKGLLATSTRHVGAAAYTTSIGSYNQLSQPLSTTVTIPEQEQTLAGTYKTEFRYDYDGGLASTHLPAIGSLPAEGIVHERDELGLPKVTRGGFDGQTMHYISDTTYTRQGELARLQYGEGTKRAWQSYYYDTHTRRLDQTIVDAELPAPMQADLRYTYDPAGNITSIADTLRGGSVDRQCFRYDHLRRLTNAWTPAGDCATDPRTEPLAGPAPYRHAYSYDKTGNRLSSMIDGVTSTYTYPEPGTARPHAVTAVATAGTTDTYSYDAAGNTIARPGQQLEWDGEGRVSKISTAEGDSTFVYDADGNRLIRRTPQATTVYLGGQELTLNRGSGALSPTRYYTHGDKAIAVRTSSGLSWLASDHQGTAQFSIDATRMTVSRLRQTPFGTKRGAAADLPGERGFVGGVEDAATELVHIGARQYDPELGRFLSVDPVMGGEPQLMNAYAYSNNSPVTFSDPTGLYCDSCDFYNHKYGEASAWSKQTKRKSFCDSCEYFSRKNKTKSAWNQRWYGDKKYEPSIYKKSREINERRAKEQKARREAEECARSFWCKVGNGIKAVGNYVVNRVKEISDSAVWKWTGVGLGVLGMFGCVACAAISVGMSMVATGANCALDPGGTSCKVGAASLALGAVAGAASGVAGNLWRHGAGQIASRVSVSVGQAVRHPWKSFGAAVWPVMKGHGNQLLARATGIAATVPASGSLGLDTASAAGGFGP
ncbi:RHS repeat-associated core domain-containing protein [Kribbella deserti]|uniref:RHS repeat-associated core domain-containing protein n=1 Tax=Kribbella deserti TaxID=1926257 RepID=A0ABV6QFP9_9ACTN